MAVRTKRLWLAAWFLLCVGCATIHEWRDDMQLRRELKAAEIPMWLHSVRMYCMTHRDCDYSDDVCWGIDLPWVPGEPER